MAKKTAAKKKVATTKPKAAPNKKTIAKASKSVVAKSAPAKAAKSLPTKATKIAAKAAVSNQLLKTSSKTKPAKVVAEAPKKKMPAPANKENQHTEGGGGDSFVASQLAKFDRSQMNEEQSRWYDYAKKFGKVRPREYKMTEQFEAQTPIFHKVLGWGYILSNEFDRLEVVFESGKKMLISNYKSN